MQNKLEPADYKSGDSIAEVYWTKACQVKFGDKDILGTFKGNLERVQNITIINRIRGIENIGGIRNKRKGGCHLTTRLTAFFYCYLLKFADGLLLFFSKIFFMFLFCNKKMENIYIFGINLFTFYYDIRTKDFYHIAHLPFPSWAKACQ